MCADRIIVKRCVVNWRAVKWCSQLKFGNCTIYGWIRFRKTTCCGLHKSPCWKCSNDCSCHNLFQSYWKCIISQNEFPWHIHICIHKEFTQKRTRMRVHINTNICLNTPTHTHTHTYTKTYTHTPTHTHKLTQTCTRTQTEPLWKQCFQSLTSTLIIKINKSLELVRLAIRPHPCKFLRFTMITFCKENFLSADSRCVKFSWEYRYGVPTIRRLLTIIGLFCKWAL